MVKKRSLLWLWHAEQNRRSALKPPPYRDWGRVRHGGCGANFSGNAVDQRPLDLDGAAHQIDDARKLRQHAFPVVLTMRPWCFCEFWIDERAVARPQTVEGLPHPPSSAASSPPYQRRASRIGGSHSQRRRIAVGCAGCRSRRRGALEPPYRPCLY